MIRSVFLRGLAIIYLIAFASLLPQMDGLIGSNGILPVKDFLDTVHAHFGAEAYAVFPTFAWINASDVFLHGMVWAGIILSVLLLVGIAPLAVTLGLYFLYLSVSTVGQTFYSFQWDALLLEVGFAAVLVAPLGWRASYSAPPSSMALWVFRLMLFRLMLESGAVKLLSGDPMWRSLTALRYHYETQPLPTPLAWYAHQLPSMAQRISVAGVFVIELAVPFLIFTTRKLRRVAAVSFIGLQLLIALTGNYTFFNLLTMLLCVFLFDPPRTEPTPWNARFVGVVLIVLGVLQLLTMFGVVSGFPEPLKSMDDQAENFHLVNSYGLFAVMTTSRVEIIVEGSNDGEKWQPYEFPYKPGDLNRRLPWVAPYQPRLDWQMWFAALSNYQSNPWFERMMERLLQGRREVTSLFAQNPFPNAPPRFIRATAYEYHFTDRATRRATGAIWTRAMAGEYFPAVSLK
jgi:hypothetical protein